MPAPTSADPDPDPDLTTEREHLARSRAQLGRMRARTASLDSDAAGDRISQQLLESAIYRRMKALEDDPTVPLFFGRLDLGDDHPDAGGERLYIGRRHVTDEIGDPMVIDWRARVSRAFYRASKAEPMGVQRRRRFGFQHGRMTAFEDERLLEDEASGAAYSEILETEIERPRVGPMRDIVATIQPEQDLIVRSELEHSVCVQGAPGTGKTAVGLHRAAYLLYAHRDRLSRQGVLVVGPNTSFLRYIGDVLPALGEIDAQQTTIEALMTKTLVKVGVAHGVRATDPPAVATVKGDARMARVLDRALWANLATPSEGLVVPRGARRWRVAGHEAEEIVAALRARGVRYGAARAMLAQRLPSAILVKMELSGDAPDDRVQDAVARSKPVKQYVDQLWPAVHPGKLVLRLLGDGPFLAAAADGILSDEEQRLLLWDKPTKGIGSARWSVADAVLIDEVDDLLGRTASVAHIVLDEAQDLSPMMLRAVGRRCSTGSATVLGDLAQATTPWGSSSWEDALAHLGKPDAHIEELTLGFRVPGEVIEYAARLLPSIAPRLEPPTSVRRTRGELVVSQVPGLVPPLADVVATTVAKVGSVGVIVPDALVAAATAALTGGGVGFAVLGAETGERDGTEVGGAEYAAKLDLVPASLAKGLEFDHVLLLEPAAIVSGEPDRLTGLRRLYLCLTRAVTSLVVLHAAHLPDELEADI